MADYSGSISAGPDPGVIARIPNQVTGVHDRVYAQAVQAVIVPSADVSAGQIYTLLPSRPVHDYNALWDLGPTRFFFELCHHTPDLIALGNILTTTLSTIELYNAFRDADIQFTSAVANAGPGVSLIGLPGLPATVPSQSGAIFQVQVTTVGPPNIDGTLDFVTDCGNFVVALTGDRVVMFSYAPESGISETLSFRTDIITAADGGEQRISIRDNPRQSFDMTLRIEEGSELRKMMTLLKGWHSGVFGVPVWWEHRELGANAAALDTTITVDTRYADFRVGGFAIIWSDSETFDALQIQSLTTTTMTFTSGLTQGFTAGESLVMPLRTGYLSSSIEARRYTKNLMDVRLSVRVIDNDVGSIESTASFSTHNSKVLLDDLNIVGGTDAPDGLTRQMIVIDSDAANEIQLTTQLTSKTVTAKGFSTATLQELWQVRQLMHALRGSQVSFYLPTFYKDIVLDQDLQSGSVLMDIESIRYVDFIRAREPFKSLWIELNDGTILTREVVAYATISSTVERLTVDTAWPSLIDKDDVARISFCRLVRISNDQVSFEHDHPGEADVSIDVLGVGTP